MLNASTRETSPEPSVDSDEHQPSKTGSDEESMVSDDQVPSNDKFESSNDQLESSNDESSESSKLSINDAKDDSFITDDEEENCHAPQNKGS